MDEITFPTDIHSLRRVIRFFSYNRTYIPRFADLIEPLTTMCHKGAEIKPNPDALKAFEALKLAVRTAPVLALMQEKVTWCYKLMAAR